MRRRTFEIVILLFGLTATTGTLACGETAKLQLVERDSSLEADFAKAVFSFHGGTAYYIGGDPGFLLTAYHVLENKNPLEPDKVCSRFVGDTSELECYEVSPVASQLPHYDLALLRLASPLPNKVRHFNLGITRTENQGQDAFRILGYGLPTEGNERTWSISRGSLRQTGLIDSRDRVAPLTNRAVYHLNIPQYPGVSGGPVVDKLGIAWATAVRSINSRQQAYGIPHDSEEFLSWLLTYTKPSKSVISYIEKIENKDLPSDQLEQWLIDRLDIRRDRLSTLDLMHLGNRICRHDSVLCFKIISCPLNRATATFVNWARIHNFNHRVAADIAEDGKQASWAMAERVSDPQLKASLMMRSGAYAQQATEYLSALLNLDDVEAEKNMNEFEKRYVNAAGLYFKSSDVPTRLVSHAAQSGIGSLFQRYQRNLEDASNAYTVAYKINGREDVRKMANTLLSLQLATKYKSNAPFDYSTFSAKYSILNKENTAVGDFQYIPAEKYQILLENATADIN